METKQHNWNSIFNRDFYPSPDHVIDLMQLSISGETILEPSAGKGNIIDYCKARGAKDVMFCEINNDLAEICKSKARFIKHDFLKVVASEVSHITQIIMNPPFTKAKDHLAHAWDIAPEGCEITCLFNTETLDRFRYESYARELRTIIETYGYSVELGNVFAEPETERKTSVGISLIKIHKPIYNSNTGFEGFYMDAEPEQVQADGIIHYNEVQSLVNSYIAAAKCFDEFSVINDQMKNICAIVGMGNGFSYNISYNKAVVDKHAFLTELQKRSWKHIFAKMKLEKYLTSGVMNDINKFVENQSQVPFTVKNIYRMFEIIVGTKDESYKRALVEAVDYFTKHTHENRFGVEGWKTNDGHMLNKKFIIDWMFEPYASYSRNAGKLHLIYSSNRDRLTDLTKVICNLTGVNYDNTTPMSQFVDRFEGIEPNRWYENGFFEFKGFKKGTMHIKFTDDWVWELLNRAYAKAKGQVLPEGTFKN
jgi:hypothetical protein